MGILDDALHIKDPEDLQKSLPELWDPGTRTVFMSASIPVKKTVPSMSDEEFEDAYLRDARPDLIRDAVAQLCRHAFSRDYRLIFGGHPAISPMVLQAATSFSSGSGPLVYVFQSEHFSRAIPKETLELARWGRGILIWTEAQPTAEASLELMRRVMLSPTSIRCGLFIGGMDGVEAEAFRFVDRFGSLFPKFAVGSTGSAARRLQEGQVSRLNQEDFEGGLGRDLSRRSYGLTMRRIFDQL